MAAKAREAEEAEKARLAAEALERCAKTPGFPSAYATCAKRCMLPPCLHTMQTHTNTNIPREAAEVALREAEAGKQV